MNGLACSLALLATLALAAPAAAQSFGVGGGVELVPVGELHVEDDSGSLTVDTETAFALAGRAEFAVNPNFAVAFAPRLVLNLKGEDGTESAKQLDLNVRFVGGAPVGGGTTRLYGYAAPGYSLIFLPDWPDELSNPAGFVLGFGGGAGFRVAPQVEVTAEIGYQLGFQEVSEAGQTVEVSSNLLHVGAGLLMSL